MVKFKDFFLVCVDVFVDLNKLVECVMIGEYCIKLKEEIFFKEVVC